MATQNNVNLSTIDYKLIQKACARRDMSRVESLKILNLYFGGKSPILDINATFPGQGLWTPLAYTVFFGKREESAFLLKNGANPNHKLSNDISFLHIAANDGKDSICVLLLESGVSINTLNSKLQTPIMSACQSGKKETVICLLNYTPNVNLKDSYGKTCLDYAKDTNNGDIATMIEHKVLSASLLDSNKLNKRVNKI